MIYSDLIEIKKVLDINVGDTSEDGKLLLFLEWASTWINEELGRPDLALKARTEYYNGTGSQKIVLRHRPVYPSPTVQVFVDEGGYFGATSGSFDSSTTNLTYGDDFTVSWDQEDGTSRSALLIRIGNFWPQPTVRERGFLSPYIGDSFGNVKVTYTAGYTPDKLPAPIRTACAFLVARLRYIFPLGVELNSESYEDRSISIVTDDRNRLMALVRPMLMGYRSWKF